MADSEKSSLDAVGEGPVSSESRAESSQESTGDPSDPAYEAAVAYYRERAWGPGFLWDWTGTGSAMTEYAGLIEASDERARQATHVLGGIIANHLVAAVDAFLSARDSPASVELRADPRGGGGALRWEATVSWRFR